MKKIMIINGANLCMLGRRKPEIYGSRTLSEICDDLRKKAEKLKVDVQFFTSNCEGEIVSKIHECIDYDGIIINAGAHTHYSHAIADALEIANGIKIEVHISNVHKREEFRHNSVISRSVDGIICGLGESVYSLALDYIATK